MDINVGHMIEVVYRHLRAKHSACTVKWLATQMNCDRRNIHDIFRRRSIDSQILIKLSKVLHHNFFKDISDLLAKEITESGEFQFPKRKRKPQQIVTSDNDTTTSEATDKTI